ncbi:hypothetical protein SAMN05216167_10143 [Spirosoma endophyticum]|uniref:Uncharacterized protein n=1 Tax=Spirosoma endophyticum TaxID=662367 RepID=A0A1I1EY35_9BACT|nr:hypothetical protein SAMN05216167_10143 [Spirosoma endophyticum]
MDVGTLWKLQKLGLPYPQLPEGGFAHSQIKPPSGG